MCILSYTGIFDSCDSSILNLKRISFSELGKCVLSYLVSVLLYLK